MQRYMFIVIIYFSACNEIVAIKYALQIRLTLIVNGTF